MKPMTITQLRRDWDAVVRSYADGNGGRLLVNRYGKPFFAIVPVEDCDLLEMVDPQEVTP